MASGNNSRQSSARRPASSGNRPRTTRTASSTRRPSSNTRKKAVTEPESGFSIFMKKFVASRFFRPVITVLFITVLVLLDLLISWNNYGRFFILLGVELIIAAVIWVIALGFNLGADLEDCGDNNDGA